MSATPQIQLLSNLHLESPSAYDVFEVEPQCGVLALLGDIGKVKDDGLFDFLKEQLRNFSLVIFVCGNHEPYHSSWSAVKERLDSFKKEVQRIAGLGEFVVLDRTRYDYSPSVTFLGCTLFSQVPADKAKVVSEKLNDFYDIAEWTVEDHVRAHQADLDWLNKQVQEISKEDPARRVIVVTHHCPLSKGEVMDPRHRDSPITSGFCTDLSAEECWTNPNVVLWAYGHTHYNCDFKDEQTGKRVVSNQRGYYFDQAAGFDMRKTIGL